MDNIDWKKKLFNELAYSHDDAHSWKCIIEDIDELNALVDFPSNKKKFHDPYWKNKLLYIIKKSNYLDYKKIYEKITATRSRVYDDEIDDYSEYFMFSEDSSDSSGSSDSSDDSNDSNDETDKMSKKSSKKPFLVKLTKKDIKKMTKKTGVNIH